MAFITLGNQLRTELVKEIYVPGTSGGCYVDFYNGTIPQYYYETCGSLIGTSQYIAGSNIWDFGNASNGTTYLIDTWAVLGVGSGTINVGRIRNAGHITLLVGNAGTSATCDFVLTDNVLAGTGSTTHLYEASLVLAAESGTRHVLMGPSHVSELIDRIRSSWAKLYLYSGTMGTTADTTAGTQLCTINVTYSTGLASSTGTIIANTVSGVATRGGTIGFGKLMKDFDNYVGFMGSAGTSVVSDAFIVDTKVVSSGGTISLENLTLVIPSNEDL